MKILNVVLTLISLLFAYWQLNDVDPIFWTSFYVYIAIVCGFAVFNKYNKYVIIVGGVLCLAVAIAYFPGITELVTEHEFSEITRTMHAGSMYVEEARESIGAMMAFAALLFQYFRAKKQDPTSFSI